MFKSGLWGDQFRNCQADITPHMLQVFLDYPGCVLGIDILLESEVVTNKSPSNCNSVVNL